MSFKESRSLLTRSCRDGLRCLLFTMITIECSCRERYCEVNIISRHVIIFLFRDREVLKHFLVEMEGFKVTFV